MQDCRKHDQGEDTRGNPEAFQHRQRLHAGGRGKLSQNFPYFSQTDYVQAQIKKENVGITYLRMLSLFDLLFDRNGPKTDEQLIDKKWFYNTRTLNVYFLKSNSFSCFMVKRHNPKTDC